MNLRTALKQRYRMAPLEVQEKATVLTLVSIVLVALLPIVFILDFRGGDMASAVGEFVIWLAMIGTLVIVWRGKYVIAVNTALVIVTAAMAFLSLTGSVNGMSELTETGYYMLAPVIMASLLGIQWVQPIAVAGAGLA